MPTLLLITQEEVLKKHRKTPKGQKEKDTLKILDLLDSFRFRPKATFFVLGWIAEKLPGLVREIHKRGHEVASHGFNHHLCGNLEKDELAQDLEKSRKILEDLTGADVYGFRAPSFAIDDNILSVIADAGYTYDSSFNPFPGMDDMERLI